MEPNTVFVTLSDARYHRKAKRTIIDLRTRGKWQGDIVYIAVDFEVPQNFIDYYDIIVKPVTHLNTDMVVNSLKMYPISATDDNRQFDKLTQWDKFDVFSEYFLKWERVVFLDAGLRVLDNVHSLLELPWKGKFLAQDDAPSYDDTKRFWNIIDINANLEMTANLFNEYSENILNERYFLNCMWMFDTSLIKIVNKKMLEDEMNKFPICRCNEMTIMNLLFTFKYKLWEPFPEFASNGKRLFGWTERDRNYGFYKTWRDFCFMKYPSTINFDCE